MAEAQSTGVDRFNEALRNLDDQLQDLRERFDDRRKNVGKEFRERTDRWTEDVRGTRVFQRAEQAYKDVEGSVDKARQQVLDVFGLATKSDLDKLARKVNTLNKKVNELLKETRA